MEIKDVKKPRWTVHTNLTSPENGQWVGTSWEFFDEEKDAEACYSRHVKTGNCSTKRHYFDKTDREHLSAAQKAWIDEQLKDDPFEMLRKGALRVMVG